MEKDVFTYLQQIVDAIILIETYTGDVSQKDFFDNLQLRDAVAMRLQLIGEICNKLPEDFKNRIPEIPWVAIVGMRNIIVHRYLEITKETVWNTVEEDLPILKASLLKELKV